MGMLEKMKAVFLVLAILALWIPFGVSIFVATLIASGIIGIIAIIEFIAG